MGVPISFLDKYSPTQFEIIKFRKGDDEKDLAINGKYTYIRIIIKNKFMKIQLNEITIKEVSNGYLNSDEEGVVAAMARN